MKTLRARIRVGGEEGEELRASCENPGEQGSELGYEVNWGRRCAAAEGAERDFKSWKHLRVAFQRKPGCIDNHFPYRTPP